MDSKSAVKQEMEKIHPSLIDLSHRIHGHPEVGFEERLASVWIEESLAEEGFRVETGACGLETAFVARAGSGPLHLAICCEYDSLPGIGHACGHNIIGAMSAGAGIALSRVADDSGLTVSVIGTPAEEVGNASGKILLLDGGAFRDVHAAMMVHPAPFDVVKPRIIAASMFDVSYRGREAHASAFPEMGINAADALTVAQTAIGLLRQHLKPGDRVHGITLKGGDAPNIIPAQTLARYIIRAQTLKELEELRPRILRCFEAGALATGSTLGIGGGDRPYSEMCHDNEIAHIYRMNAESLGRQFLDDEAIIQRAAASTDMGNVSLALPSIHPFIGINSFPAVNHQPEFAAHCITQDADKALFDGALAMAWTAIDMALSKSLRERLINPAAL